jgi:hypothetical protein
VAGENVTEESIKTSTEKTDVGLDVEASLDQQEVQAEKAANVVEPNVEVHAVEENENNSGRTVVNPPTDEEKRTTTKTQEVDMASDGEDTVEKEDNDVVDLDEEDSLEVPLSKTYGRIAKRLRRSSGQAVPAATKTPTTRMKSFVVGPKKGWSKVTPKAPTGKKSKKRQAVGSSDSDFEDVEEDVPNIPTSMSKKSAGKKTSTSVSVVPTDNISFHYPEFAQRWKYVFNRRLALERELGPDAFEIKEVVKLIKNAGLEKTVSNVGDCYEKLVKEFLVNIPADCDDPASNDYQIVYVKGRKVKFSATIISRYLGINEIDCVDAEISDNQVCKVITANQVKVWPKKGKISLGKLFVKYTILNRIGAANWVPTTHSSNIATGMAKFIYCIGTKTKMNFGAYIFYQTVRHGRSEAVKLPIAFPTLLCSIILDQQPGILTAADVPKKREFPLSLHYKLFGSNLLQTVVLLRLAAS